MTDTAFSSPAFSFLKTLAFSPQLTTPIRIFREGVDAFSMSKGLNLTNGAHRAELLALIFFKINADCYPNGQDYVYKNIKASDLSGQSGGSWMSSGVVEALMDIFSRDELIQNIPDLSPPSSLWDVVLKSMFIKEQFLKIDGWVSLHPSGVSSWRSHPCSLKQYDHKKQPQNFLELSASKLLNNQNLSGGLSDLDRAIEKLMADGHLDPTTLPLNMIGTPTLWNGFLSAGGNPSIPYPGELYKNKVPPFWAHVIIRKDYWKSHHPGFLSAVTEWAKQNHPEEHEELRQDLYFQNLKFGGYQTLEQIKSRIKSESDWFKLKNEHGQTPMMLSVGAHSSVYKEFSREKVRPFLFARDKNGANVLHYFCKNHSPFDPEAFLHFFHLSHNDQSLLDLDDNGGGFVFHSFPHASSHIKPEQLDKKIINFDPEKIWSFPKGKDKFWVRELLLTDIKNKRQPDCRSQLCTLALLYLKNAPDLPLFANAAMAIALSVFQGELENSSGALGNVSKIASNLGLKDRDDLLNLIKSRRQEVLSKPLMLPMIREEESEYLLTIAGVHRKMQELFSEVLAHHSKYKMNAELKKIKPHLHEDALPVKRKM